MSFIYRGLKEKLERHTVTDEEVDRQIQRLQQQNQRITLVEDRPTQLGDEIILDYAGFCDGEQFAGGTAQDQTLVLGSGSFIPGFEEQLVDKVPGERVTVEVAFPQKYHARELAGKPAQFHCTVKAIRIKTPYELDDVFAREIGQCDTFAEFRAKLKESLQAYADEQGEMDLQDKLLRQATASLEMSVPEEELNAAVEQQLQNMKAQLAQQGLTLEMYCSFMDTTEEKLREDARPAAEYAIRSQAAVDKIVELEKLEATQEEIDQALALVCRQNRMTIEQIKPYYNAEFEAAIRRSVLTSKAMRLIRDTAEIEE